MNEIRTERPEDMQAVREVLLRAFGGPEETDVVDALRRDCAGMLSLVAVLPEYQRKGVGSALVRAGLAQLQSTPCPFVIVLGHPEYYRRFDFEPASRYGIRSEWDVPDEAFMIRIFDEAVMQGISGVARYRPEFARAM